jgi:hypothetical protein
VTKRDITIRVHATDRVKSIENVSLSLSTTVYDRIKAGEALSLGVMLDCTNSMRGAIEGCEKGALSMITTFQGLAPVGSFNFMGYWDPVMNSASPRPKSTGYLTSNKKNMDRLQMFVNTELVCHYGGYSGGS